MGIKETCGSGRIEKKVIYLSLRNSQPSWEILAHRKIKIMSII